MRKIAGNTGLLYTTAYESRLYDGLEGRRRGVGRGKEPGRDIACSTWRYGHLRIRFENDYVEDLSLPPQHSPHPITYVYMYTINTHSCERITKRDFFFFFFSSIQLNVTAQKHLETILTVFCWRPA